MLTHLVSPVPEYECRRLRAVRYDAGQVDQAPLFNERKEKKEMSYRAIYGVC